MNLPVNSFIIIHQERSCHFNISSSIFPHICCTGCSRLELVFTLLSMVPSLSRWHNRKGHLHCRRGLISPSSFLLGLSCSAPQCFSLRGGSLCGALLSFQIAPLVTSVRNTSEPSLFDLKHQQERNTTGD